MKPDTEYWETQRKQKVSPDPYETQLRRWHRELDKLLFQASGLSRSPDLAEVLIIVEDLHYHLEWMLRSPDPLGKQTSYDEGYSQGHDDGHSEGQRVGREEGIPHEVQTIVRNMVTFLETGLVTITALAKNRRAPSLAATVQGLRTEFNTSLRIPLDEFFSVKQLPPKEEEELLQGIHETTLTINWRTRATEDGVLPRFEELVAVRVPANVAYDLATLDGPPVANPTDPDFLDL